jgi:hypothetical protein
VCNLQNALTMVCVTVDMHQLYPEFDPYTAASEFDLPVAIFTEIPMIK